MAEIVIKIKIKTLGTPPTAIITHRLNISTLVFSLFVPSIMNDRAVGVMKYTFQTKRKGDVTILGVEVVTIAID